MNDENSETNGNDKKKELISVSVILFEGTEADDLSKRVRDIRVGDGENKFTITFPIPTSDEEAQKFYNRDIVDLIADGCRQATYDADNSIRNLISENRDKGVDPNDYADKVKSELEEALTTTKEKKTSEARKIKEAKAETGMSVDEMIKLAKMAKEAGLDE